ncbi:hypothetical protein [Roseimicrobium sp. ORNL1]|uniref:hypothetical protein n=1 Tax=Roseimicrobium sp. ORNL1 TaxID=2711231 RepID=UPI0013E129BC|nr:hypothetical protein [Roseimicrobium sp. ORNL1]QIF01983.1 hypothetical protein G5S37_10720 [Roseimicrobium sp. ORNL1]
MSRRAKLLITALFIVLLTVPVVYGCLFWSIEQPLRFRCITVLPEDTGKLLISLPHEPVVPFIFEVQNTRPYPVYFQDMSILAYYPESPLPDGYLSMDYVTRSVRDKSLWAAPSLYGQYIPAHGVTRFEVLMRPKTVSEFETGKIKLVSFWASVPRRLAYDARNWVHPRLRKTLRFARLPYVSSSQQGPATLEGLPVVIPRPVMSSPPSPPPP